MTEERYRELCAAGPVITAMEQQQLKAFSPKVRPTVYYVWLALHRPNAQVAA